MSEDLEVCLAAGGPRFQGREELGIDGVNEGILLPALSRELGISPSVLSGELGSNGELGVHGGELGIDGGALLPALSGELGGDWGSPNS